MKLLQDVGLGYLTLDRNAVTLSGGEAQRIRLAGQLGSGLTGVTFVLDEPTIGLHSRDTGRLLSVLEELRDSGNTVVVVEHDAEVMRAADYIIDMGPGAGTEGGQIIARGSLEEVMENCDSKTATYLKNPHALPVPGKRRQLSEGIRIGKAFANNLKDIDLHIPMNGLTVLTGISGSGKSTLLFDVLAASVEQKKPAGCDSITLPEVPLIPVDQKGIGAGSTSNPATYTGLFDKIRDLFAKTDTAREKGYKKNRFSFNVKGGRCETCQGAGEIRTSMDFLADVSTPCETCDGKRYNRETLQCHLNGKHIADVLAMTVSEAMEFFREYSAVYRVLETMEAVGLGYLQLGRPGGTLSGGEAQRLKLVTRLIKDTKGTNIYLFDEPTTGLHFRDVKQLLVLFHKLVDAGHTLLVIEHHPDIIKNADYIIDMGPEGGDRG
ncbi:MAG: ATP-binding cassette domain-containing protein, partial [bacterium]|nr:ATP-binding cassette domain-containing protein [bacterium]